MSTEVLSQPVAASKLLEPASPVPASAPSTADSIIEIKVEPMEPATPVRLLMGISSVPDTPPSPLPQRASSADPTEPTRASAPSPHSQHAKSTPTSPEQKPAVLPSPADPRLMVMNNDKKRPPMTRHSLPLTYTSKPALMYKVDHAALDAHRASLEAAKRKRVASIAPIRQEVCPFSTLCLFLDSDAFLDATVATCSTHVQANWNATQQSSSVQITGRGPVIL
jgi:hypothetical protein